MTSLGSDAIPRRPSGSFSRGKAPSTVPSSICRPRRAGYASKGIPHVFDVYGLTERLVAPRRVGVERGLEVVHRFMLPA